MIIGKPHNKKSREEFDRIFGKRNPIRDAIEGRCPVRKIGRNELLKLYPYIKSAKN